MGSCHLDKGVLIVGGVAGDGGNRRGELVGVGLSQLNNIGGGDSVELDAGFIMIIMPQSLVMGVPEVDAKDVTEV